MNLRWNSALAAILIFVLIVNCVRAQDPQFTAGRVHVRDILRDRQEPLAPFESALGQSESRTRRVLYDEIDDLLEARLAPTETIGLVMQPPPGFTDSGGGQLGDAERFAGRFSTDPGRRFDIGVDLYSAPDFEGGLIIFGPDVAMKIGGYVKADFIQDFNPINETDTFVTTSIPVGAPQRTNSRFHARQTRLSFDTRWASDEQTVQIFVEGDFFSDGDRYRLRHGYGEVGRLLVGQTWTTFTDVAAAPATLDFEGSLSSVNRRQAQARWTQ